LYEDTRATRNLQRSQQCAFEARQEDAVDGRICNGFDSSKGNWIIVSVSSAVSHAVALARDDESLIPRNFEALFTEMREKYNRKENSYLDMHNVQIMTHTRQGSRQL
jgi:hypothetical protein